MHRKSLEAAEQLKDDTCSSDRDDQQETSSLATDKSDASARGASPAGAAEGGGDDQQRQRLEELRHQLSAAEDPEQFRNHSIACLRAKAQEHSAKLLGMGDANGNTLHRGADLALASSDTSSSMF
ncbi:hypothetical protein PR048_018543 [Dryococelus australis]|uniref:OAR domain-containing protein n=1 Tax=Dryococelus australis TaxID=614101 RepID=A0ABQ9HCU5_9NEOP|nr:hypothetical protein PR048_018543 [Dryococelus australis]